eukprot:3850637-Pleurochrysis_carterae.AAC.1
MYATQNDNCPPSLDETPRLDAAKPCLNALEANAPCPPSRLLRRALGVRGPQQGPHQSPRRQRHPQLASTPHAHRHGSTELGA